MAYSSSGKKVYVSIKDLPQYTSIGSGDKIIVWNETREGAAVVDFDDFMIDLEHCTFKSTITEIVTLASDIETFIGTTAETIESIQESIVNIENTINDELRNRIKTLEFIVAVMLGANSYWQSGTGLSSLREKFILEGINKSSTGDLSQAETETQRNAIRWYSGFISAVQNNISRLVPGVKNDDILLQTKYNYRYIDPSAVITSVSETPPISTKMLTEISSTQSGTTTTTTLTYS